MDSALTGVAAGGAVAPAGRADENLTRPDASAAELLLAGAIILAAFVARMWALGGVGIDHFDEGVYVMSALGVSQPGHGLFPNQVVFSPPFYFGTVGLVHWLFGGAPDRAAIIVNIVLGTLTVAAVWWVGRVWFTPRAAVMTATLLAFSQFHILFSRVALTDVAFAFWFLLALGAIVLAVDRSDFRLALLAGVATGMAWNTKYHGWFALVISGVALAPTLWAGRRDGAWKRPLAVWGTICITALAAYLPWAIFMRDAEAGGGGYGGIVRYFADMLRGAWLANIGRHAAQQAYLEGALSRAAPLAAMGAGLLLSGRRRANGVRLLLLAGTLAAAALLMGHSGVALILALGALPLLLREFGAYRSRVLLCWVGLWVVAAPFYHPYPRLLLPFTIATLLLAGAVLDRLLVRATGDGRDPPDTGDAHAPQEARARQPRGVHGAVAGIACVAAAGLLFIVSATVRSDVSDPWSPSRMHVDAAARINEMVPAGQHVSVMGEPSLVHYLRALGRDVPMNPRPADLDSLSAADYFVTGVYVDRAPPLRNRVNRMADRITRVAVIPFDPSDLRLLDDLRPDVARQFRAARDTTFDLTVYRVDR